MQDYGAQLGLLKKEGEKNWQQTDGVIYSHIRLEGIVLRF